MKRTFRIIPFSLILYLFFTHASISAASLGGDINKDNTVNINDYNLIITNFNKTGALGWIPSDIDKNGKVDIFDYNILIENFNKKINASVVTPTVTSAPIPASIATLINKKMVFAEKYRTNTGGVMNEFVSLGYYEFLANAQVKIHVILFDGKNNVYPTASLKKHGTMNAPHWNGICQPGPIYKPTPTATNDYIGSWTTDGTIIKVKIGAITHEWRLMDKKTSYYRVNKDLMDSANTKTSFTDTDGFGYLTDAVSSEQINKTHLLTKYSSELWQNAGTVNTPWVRPPNSLSTNYFKPTTDQRVISYSYPAPYEDEPTMWAETSILFNDAPSTNLLIFMNGGHEFNKNGCLDADETGHAQQLLGVKEGNTITKMVGIEYSYESDGYPILSILRYF